MREIGRMLDLEAPWETFSGYLEMKWPTSAFNTTNLWNKGDSIKQNDQFIAILDREERSEDTFDCIQREVKTTSRQSQVTRQIKEGVYVVPTPKNADGGYNWERTYQDLMLKRKLLTTEQFPNPHIIVVPKLALCEQARITDEDAMSCVVAELLAKLQASAWVFP